ncbi:MAG: glycosyltransferase family 2 protein, partial [Planctomycetes bacterium]|nr:glycosyltransferase family 2 protein [Planctomycetota bacterium]
MVYIEIAFWLAAAGVLYTYLGYPLLMAGLARFRVRPVQRGDGLSRSVSIVLAVYNEEVNIARRLVEFTQLFAKTGLRGEILVVSD